jgi:4-amino-4-deoxy-L-arabinose transferase-like glycosyltransferase
MGERRRVIYVLLGITALAAALRIFHLDYKALNGGDEPYQFALAQRPFWEMFELFGYEANAAIYSVLLWPLVRLGESEALIRAPAALFGILAVPAIWWAGRTYVSDRVGLMAAALMAVSPMAIFQSQFARPFTLVICLACVSFVALYFGITDGRRRWWVIYAVALAGMAYSNAVTPFAIGLAHVVIVWWNRETALKPWLLSLAGAAILCIPQAVALVIARSRRDPLYWLESPGLGAINNTLREFFAGLGFNYLAYGGSMVLVLAVLAILIVRNRRARRPDDVEDVDAWDGTWLGIPKELWLWTFVPPISLFCVSQVEPVFRSAYAISALPGLFLLMAAAFDRLGGRLRWIALAAALALALYGTVWQTTRQVDETWPSALGWIEENREAGDRVMLDITPVFPVFGYYEERYRAPNGELIVNEWEEYPLPDDIVPLDDPGGYGGPGTIEGPPTREQFQELASGDRRLFLVLAEYGKWLQGDIPAGPAMRWARENCEVVENDDQVLIDLFLISDCPTPGESQ